MSELSFGQRLFLLRGKMSRKVFAEKLGVGTATLQRYENDERKPDLDFLMKICEITGLSLDYLVYGTHNQALSTNERVVLEKYKLANTETKNQVLMLLLGGVFDDSQDIDRDKKETFTQEQINKAFGFVFNDEMNEKDESSIKGIVNSPNSNISNSFNQGGFTETHFIVFGAVFAMPAFLLGGLANILAIKSFDTSLMAGVPAVVLSCLAIGCLIMVGLEQRKRGLL